MNNQISISHNAKPSKIIKAHFGPGEVFLGVVGVVAAIYTIAGYYQNQKKKKSISNVIPKWRGISIYLIPMSNPSNPKKPNSVEDSRKPKDNLRGDIFVLCCLEDEKPASIKTIAKILNTYESVIYRAIQHDMSEGRVEKTKNNEYIITTDGHNHLYNRRHY